MKTKSLFLVICCWIAMLNTASAKNLPFHEFHISTCQIEYNSEEKALQITLHLYIDDLEAALKEEGVKPLDLCIESEAEDADQHLYAYLQKYFRLEINQQATTYTFVGKEQSENLIGLWFYLEVTSLEDIKTLDITNQVLLKTFGDQKNVTSIVVIPGKQHYFIMQNGKDREFIEY